MRALILLPLLFCFTMAENYWDQTDDKPYFKQRDNKAHILVGVAIGVGVAKESDDTRFDSQDVTGYALGSVISSSLIVWQF